MVTRIGQERVLFGNETPGADCEPVDAVEMTRLEALARVLTNQVGNPELGNSIPPDWR